METKQDGTDKHQEEEVRKHVFLGEMEESISFSGTMEHLACFVPGMLALGADLISKIPENDRTEEEQTRAKLAKDDLVI